MRMNVVARGVLILLCCLVFCRPGLACDMMGASFDKDVEFGRLLSKFSELSHRNADGWGVAFYCDSSATIFKEPIPIGKSDLASFLIENRTVRSKILITHLRHASIGRPSPRNTHPWKRELDGKDYALAHVGGADKRLWKTARLGRFQPIGENCAEYLFCHILANIEDQGTKLWDKESFARLHKVLSKVNEVQTTSHLMSDGTYLFAFSSNKSSWLAYTKREMPAVKNDEKKKMTDEKPATGVVIARNGHNLAKPDEKWTKIQPGQLVVFKDGKVVYQSQ